MEINPYYHSFKENEVFYIYCLYIGKIKRINRFVPVTKVTLKESKNFIFQDLNGNEIEYKKGTFYCKLFYNFNDAVKTFNYDKNEAIYSIANTIQDLENLKTKIQNL